MRIATSFELSSFSASSKKSSFSAGQETRYIALFSSFAGVSVTSEQSTRFRAAEGTRWPKPGTPANSATMLERHGFHLTWLASIRSRRYGVPSVSAVLTKCLKIVKGPRPVQRIALNLNHVCFK
jgi:hypothetical protein